MKTATQSAGKGGQSLLRDKIRDAVVITSAPKRGHDSGDEGDILERLRGDILSGKLEPGQRLKFEDLREKYHGSIATLREALLHLLSEGMVRSEQNRGFTVAPVSLVDFADITELRVQFEVQCLADAIQHGDDAWEAEIVKTLHLLLKLIDDGEGTRSPLWPSRHRQFHAALVASCRSPWLLHFRSVLFDQAERYRSLGRIYRKSPRDVAADHKLLANAVIARDVVAACSLGEKHIRSTADNVISNVPGLLKSKPR